MDVKRSVSFMEFICESDDLNNYLIESEEINYSALIIKEKAAELFNSLQTEIEKVKVAFEFVRDEISHSWDIQGSRITCNASEVLTYKEGICYAKSHLLAALLRSQGIPTGFCYQRLMLFDTPNKGYCIHALNAVFLKSVNKWVRLDARGNRKHVNAQFSIEEEKLAFLIQEELDEKDYPMIYINPHPKTIAVLKEKGDIKELYEFYLPERL